MSAKLPENGNKSLNDIKRTLKQKATMRRCEYFLCDACDKPIYQPEDGYIVHGNIYVADASGRGGLIGNNFPEVNPGDKIEVTEVRETVYCKRCFIKALGLLDSRDASASGDFSAKPQSPDFHGILSNLGVDPRHQVKGRDKRAIRPQSAPIVDVEAFLRT